MKEKCKIKIKRDWLGRYKEVTISKDCNKKQLEPALKKRNININDINLFKKN